MMLDYANLPPQYEVVLSGFTTLLCGCLCHCQNISMQFQAFSPYFIAHQLKVVNLVIEA